MSRAPAPGAILGIEISNPNSGPRGVVEGGGGGGGVLAGPGVALMRDGRVLGEEPLLERMRHDDDLIPAIDRLCGRAKVGPRGLGRIAVSVGPGGYTSLRIAVATAKMLAEATGAQTVAVETALAVAWRLETSLAPALLCLASKGETAHATLLPAARESPWWQEVGRPVLERLLGEKAFDEIDHKVRFGRWWLGAACTLGLIGAVPLALLRPRTVIADEHLPAAMREAAVQVGAAVIPPVYSAAVVCSLGARLPPTDPLALAPIYPREPDAVTQWRARKSG